MGNDKSSEQQRFQTDGGWLPRDHKHHRSWLQSTLKHVESNPTPPEKFDESIKGLKDLIENNTRIFMLFETMFSEIPNKAPYNRDPKGNPEIRDYHHLLEVLNHVITTAPAWSDKGESVGLVGIPINAILDWGMGTKAGFSLFLDPQLNQAFKKILNAWGSYLRSPPSADVLDGWLSPHGLQHLEEAANVEGPKRKFEEIYKCEKEKKHYGFKSWDDFFTRHFREHVRPVASPDDDDVIANACESVPYAVAHNVKARDRFWTKGQPYSVKDMLDNDEWADQFVGGTIYQAFLSSLSYHRWHSPVSGTIVKVRNIDGTYYSEPLFSDFDEMKDGADAQGEVTSQAYQAAVATRALIFIEADNKKIGLMCFVGVGMVEVSTCDIGVKVGQKVKKGDEIGMFHFGGSTHCLLFRKGVKIEGFPKAGGSKNVPLRSHLAKVV
ncbi:phosphatidylserine decarboxylase family protein [Atractiella rhizophila]|nr:phosphatidylserine decarboxylase family protein [Atractiella rhizophila]